MHSDNFPPPPLLLRFNFSPRQISLRRAVWVYSPKRCIFKAFFPFFNVIFLPFYFPFFIFSLFNFFPSWPFPPYHSILHNIYPWGLFTDFTLGANVSWTSCKEYPTCVLGRMGRIFSVCLVFLSVCLSFYLSGWVGFFFGTIPNNPATPDNISDQILPDINHRSSFDLLMSYIDIKGLRLTTSHKNLVAKKWSYRKRCNGRNQRICLAPAVLWSLDG